MADIDELTGAYWEHYRLATSDERADRSRAEESQWAWEEVEALVRNEPEGAIATLTILADSAPDDGALAYLGAGPIENLLYGCRSLVVIDRVDGAAMRNPNFRKAMRCAWFDDYLPPADAQRLRRFGGPL